MFKNIFLAPALFCVVGCGRSVAPPPSWNNGQGIVNGHIVEANNDLAKSVVALVIETSEGEALCSGTLVDTETVLTAAHCVEDNPSKMVVVFSHKIKKTKDESMRMGDRFVQNPLWQKNSKHGRGDLALVHFTGGVPRGYSPVTLAAADTAISTGAEVLLMGYGVTNASTNKGDGTLRSTTTKIIGDISPTELVTDGTSSSVCFGDSGGPAFLKVGPDYVQWGVASAVLGEACEQASVHTVVIGYEDWIEEASAQLAHEAIPPQTANFQIE